jgi:hypothetical protein
MNACQTRIPICIPRIHSQSFDPKFDECAVSSECEFGSQTGPKPRRLTTVEGGSFPSIYLPSLSDD